jgi:tRNA U34 5-methylaminomethyl-2-thiouridine-forming methyltransferase MnmC
MDDRPKLKIFELGFGTGLNCILSLQATNMSSTTIEYYGIEKYPVSSEVLKSLNYDIYLPDPEHKILYKIMHKIAWGELIKIAPWFYLKKIKSDIFNFDTNEQFDLIYYDAFAPAKQPEMWSLEILQKFYKLTAPGGVLVTYCAKGQFKRDLKQVGFVVHTLPGPKGKREMTKATKPIE